MVMAETGALDKHPGKGLSRAAAEPSGEDILKKARLNMPALLSPEQKINMTTGSA